MRACGREEGANDRRRLGMVRDGRRRAHATDTAWAHAACCPPFVQPFLSHLFTLWEHNLLHQEDVHDCVLIVDATAATASGEPGRPVAELCTACERPLHEPHCALFGVSRGVAAWPPSNATPNSKVVAVGLWEPAVGV